MSNDQKCGLCIIAWDGSVIPCKEHDDRVPYLRVPELPLPEFTAQLDAIAVPRRKTGVIVGSTTDSAEHCMAVRAQLQRMFPEVRIAVVPHAQSVAFEWEVDE